ncbi:MAG: helix-turn-helix transcriptional regulator [Clostridiales bacterium]|nr:helix-turn-helix transcriptional regulator [Clostridiales bacterium]
MEIQNKNLEAKIGLRIKKERMLLNLSQENFSELLGFSQKYISELERGRKLLSLSSAIHICETFHLSLDYLILGKENIYSNVDSVKEDYNYQEVMHLYEICPDNDKKHVLDIMQRIISNSLSRK